MKQINFDESQSTADFNIKNYIDYGTLVDLFLGKLADLTKQVESRGLRIRNNKEKIIAIQNFSDWHIGKKVFLGGKVSFDLDTAKKFLRRIFDDSLSAISSRNIKRLAVAINGDMVEGGGVNFLHQPYSVQIPLDSQIEESAKLIWEYIITASEIVEEVVVIAVVGNHGKAKIPDPTANFDLITYRYIAHMLKHEQSNGMYTNIRINISPDEFFNFSPYRGFTLHVRHLTRAKQAKTAAGRARFLSLCDIHNIDAVLSGHWHSFSCEEINGKWNIINGSIVGMDEYAEKLNLSSSPSQILNIFEDNKMVELHVLT